jgi:hypothetical protein
MRIGLLPFKCDTDVGVSELHLFEKGELASKLASFFRRSWLSMRATLSFDVMGDAPEE